LKHVKETQLATKKLTESREKVDLLAASQMPKQGITFGKNNNFHRLIGYLCFLWKSHP
jgi:hypothetical protein